MEKMSSELKQINKVLVANRGEIAVRIFNTLHKMGICSVAVYSEADAGALHYKMANERHLLKGKSLAETYLNIDLLIEIAKHNDVDAIHPGYGFLSENPHFAKAAADAGLIFIGPSAEAIRLMGNKLEARELAKKAGLPVIEGATGDNASLITKAEEIGFPVMVKAAAGGGGKGMRVAQSTEELVEVLETTQREAEKYFGDPQVYLEKYLPSPRHIEVQLLADSHGKVLSLYERECSLQRRHQKIIEEAPAPNITEPMREQLTKAAKMLASRIGYESAGTVEFLVQGDDYYFLEMNTRIQVEHPVTEMITGIDIVKEQLHIATGRPLPYTQEDIKLNGHAIEARVYAEDPENNFLPSPGKVLLHHKPSGPRLRIDSAMDGPGKISSQFDPMISKVVFHANSRETARKKIVQHLKNYVIFGVKTNISFLANLLDSEAFVNGIAHTKLIDQQLKSFTHSNTAKQANMQLLTMAYLFIHPGKCNECESTWHHIGHWRLMPVANIIIDGEQIDQRYNYHNQNEMTIQNDGREILFRLLSRDDLSLQVEAEGIIHKVYYLSVNGEVLFQLDGIASRVSPARYLGNDILKLINENPVLEGESLINAPMHGTVIKTLVKEGDIVNKGDTLVILESMKMENKISATAKAYVKKVSVGAGDVIADNSPLVLLTNKLT